MKTYLFIAAILALAALFLFAMPSEGDRRPHRKLRARETVHGVVGSGKRMGRSTGKAFKNVDFGGSR